MGRFLKKCLRLILWLLVICLVLTAGALLLGRKDDLRDLLGKIMAGGQKEEADRLDGEDLFDPDYPTAREDVDVTFERNEVRSLKIEAGGCGVMTEASPDDRIYVKTENIGEIQVYEKENCLYISGMRKVLEDASQCSILLALPADMRFDQAELELGAGTMNISALEADSLKLEVGAGQITAGTVTAGNADFSVGAGQLVIREMTVREGSVSVGAGHFEAEGAVGQKLAVECSVGAAALTLTGKAADFNYELEGIAGNILIGEEEYKGFLVKRDVDHQAARDLELECSLGEIRVNFR